MGCFVYVFLGSTRAVTIGPTALLGYYFYTISGIIYGILHLLFDYSGLLTHDGALLMGPEAAVLLAFLTGCISLLFGICNFG